jgi:hypothetical protein
VERKSPRERSGVHEGFCPLARAWAGVKPSAGAWGRRKSPTTKKGLNRCQSSRVIILESAFSRWRDKKCRLRGFRESAGAVCLVTFEGKTVSVLPGFLNQGERVWDKAKLVLWYWQAAFGSFHGFTESSQARGVMNGRGCPLQHGQALRF